MQKIEFRVVVLRIGIILLKYCNSDSEAPQYARLTKSQVNF